MAEVRSLEVGVHVKTDKASVENAERSLEKLAEKAADFVKELLAIESVKLFAELILGTAELADRMGKAALRAGANAEELQKLAFAAEKADVSQDELLAGVGHLSRGMAEAAGGSKEMQKAFAHAGVSIYDASGRLKEPTKLFTELADGITNIQDPAQRSATAMQLFGRSGAEFLPLFAQGSEGIKAAGEDLEALGAVMDEEFIEKSEKLNDSLKDLNKVWLGIKKAISGPFIDTVNKAIDAFMRWYKINKDLVQQKFHDYAEALSKIFEVVAQALDPVIALVRLVFQGLGELNPIVVTLGIALGVLAATVESPFLLMAAAVAAVLLILEDLYTWVIGGRSLIGEFGDAVENFLNKLFATNPGDPAWLVTLKEAAQAVVAVVFGLLDEFRDFLKIVLTEPEKLIDYFTDKLETAAKFWKGVFGGGGADATVTSNVNHAFGGGSSPAASTTDNSSSSSISAVNAPVIAPQITINAGAGQSTTDIASAVQDAFSEHITAQTQAAFSQLVPAVR